MADRSAVPEEYPGGEPRSEAGAGRAGRLGARLSGLWHRIRAGEDPLAFGAVVVAVALAAGLAWFWVGARHAGVPAASAAPNPPAASDSAAGATVPAPGEAGGAAGAADGIPPGAAPETLAVHVAGAVARPGLYHLPAGSRVADAVARAGGQRPGADLDRLNLAARLIDGQKVLVPRRGEPAPPEGGAGAGGGTSGSPAAGPGLPIDLNQADLAALDSLPGIGPATARAILEERARRGGFRSVRDLLRVPGIGDTRFARLKDLVRV